MSICFCMVFGGGVVYTHGVKCCWWGHTTTAANARLARRNKSIKKSRFRNEAGFFVLVLY
jgi:hypothetical protein